MLYFFARLLPTLFASLLITGLLIDLTSVSSPIIIAKGLKGSISSNKTFIILSIICPCP